MKIVPTTVGCADAVEEHKIACPTCGRLIIEPPAPVLGDGSVWSKDKSVQPLMNMTEVFNQLEKAEQRHRLNPKDVDVLQALWSWQEIVRKRRWRRSA